MVSKKFKNIKLRKKFFRAEFNKNVTKFLFTNILNSKNLDKEQKLKLVPYFTRKLDKKVSKVRIYRMCILVNKARVSNRVFGISRIALKDILKSGMIPGYSKAAW